MVDTRKFHEVFQGKKQPSKSLKSRFGFCWNRSGIWKKNASNLIPPVFLNNELNAQKLSVVFAMETRLQSLVVTEGIFRSRIRNRGLPRFSLGKVAEDLGDKSKKHYSPEVSPSPGKIPSQ